MRIRRKTDGEAPFINITPLLDVMFILLIFFLATSTFQREEHDIQVILPERDDSRPLSEAARTLVINVRKTGDYYLQDRVRTLEEVRQALLDAARRDPDQKVLIRGDREALHGHVAAAVGACRSAGIFEANIGYQYKTMPY